MDLSKCYPSDSSGSSHGVGPYDRNNQNSESRKSDNSKTNQPSIPRQAVPYFYFYGKIGRYRRKTIGDFWCNKKQTTENNACARASSPDNFDKSSLPHHIVVRPIQQTHLDGPLADVMHGDADFQKKLRLLKIPWPYNSQLEQIFAGVEDTTSDPRSGISKRKRPKLDQEALR